MADSTHPEQALQAPTNPPNSPAPPAIGGQGGSPNPATAPTKYDVLPPRSKPMDTSTFPPSSSTARVQPSPTTPSVSAPLDTDVQRSAQLLASARAKLAAQKEATTASTLSSAPTPPNDAEVQVFEVSKLKTIKCDICQQRNTNILYKCQNCTFHHQICSHCVETSDPKVPAGSLARKDWSVHAKLKDAHAAYKQPVCLGKNSDGTYERNGIKFVLAQGKRGGTKKPRKTTPKPDVTPAERNAAANLAIGFNKTTELGKRIMAEARARIDRSTSADLRDRIEARRASGVGEETAKAESEDGKRKAEVLDEDEADEHEDGKAQALGDEDRTASSPHPARE